MRYGETSYSLVPTLIGTITAGATACGAPVDTRGFAQVMAVLIAGAGYGTGANAATLNVKIQEAATITATGSAWTDVTDGAVSAGSFKFSQLAWSDVTSPVMQMDLQSEKWSDANRKRYIRAHATCAGTAGSSPKYSVGILLGKPNDTLYITGAVSKATDSIEFTVGR